MTSCYLQLAQTGPNKAPQQTAKRVTKTNPTERPKIKTFSSDPYLDLINQLNEHINANLDGAE